MKSLLLVLLGCMLISGGAQAAELILGEDAGVPGHLQVDNRYPYSFTQNADPTTLNAGTYTCGNTVYNYITDTWCGRRFYFADEGIATPFTVQSIDWGVRRFVALLDSIPGPYSVQLKAYTIPVGAEILFANMTEIASVDVPITTADNPVPPAVGVPKHTDITAQINDPVNNDLIIAWFAPHTYDIIPHVRFATSASNLGETYESYYAFEGCGFPDPVTPTTLGGPGQSQLVVVVNGDVNEQVPEACCFADGSCQLLLEADCVAAGGTFLGGPCDPNPCPPVPTENKSWGQVKEMYH